MRRRALLVGLWLLGAGVAVTFAFIAVDRVARGVVEPSVAALSRTAIDHELTATTARRPSPGPGAPVETTTRLTPIAGTGSHTRPSPAGDGATLPLPPLSPTSLPDTALSAPAANTEPTTTKRPTQVSESTTVAVPTTVGVTTTSTTAPSNAGDTMTTSRGGTMWSYCSGPEKIVFVAAVPMSGYSRTLDIENPGDIRERFSNGRSSSLIEAECSNGIVHASVEEESGG